VDDVALGALGSAPDLRQTRGELGGHPFGFAHLPVPTLARVAEPGRARVGMSDRQPAPATPRGPGVQPALTASPACPAAVQGGKTGPHTPPACGAVRPEIWDALGALHLLKDSRCKPN